MRSPSSEKIECPLCCGAGELSRAEILDRLGVKDFARVAQLIRRGSIPPASEQARPRAPERVVSLRDRTGEAHRRDQGAATRTNCASPLPKRKTSAAESRTACGNSPSFARRTSNSKPRWRRSPASASAKRWTSPRRRGLGLGFGSATSCRAMATSFSRTAPRTAILPSRKFSSTTRTNRQSPRATSRSWCAMPRSARSRSPRWSPARRASFVRLTGNRGGAARTESGCSEPPGSGSSAISTC